MHLQGIAVIQNKLKKVFSNCSKNAMINKENIERSCPTFSSNIFCFNILVHNHILISILLDVPERDTVQILPTCLLLHSVLFPKTFQFLTI